jgi:5,10-methylene-tetrahydrofolate dehydrogenase/methenyl tetrahydrofolate cyclohydrolase
MVATNIDGKLVARQILEGARIQVGKFPKRPGLALIWIGKATRLIQKKKQELVEANLVCFSYHLKESATQEELLQLISKLNTKTEVHGIQVQLPLPRNFNEQVVIESIVPEKDVDGMSPRNVALLSQSNLHINNKKVNWRRLDEVPFCVPTTPQGCIELLNAYEVVIKGANAVVVGRSNLLGLPVAHLLRHLDATVTVVHSKTVNPASIIRKADILITAAGKANLVKGSWLKPNCTVIDCGMNLVPDAYAKKGFVLVGDVDHDGARQVCKQINPVGEIEHMTVAMLVCNTVNCYKRQHRAAMLRASF